VDAKKDRTALVAKKSAPWIRSKYATVFLALISFAESVFAPILIDPFLIALILAHPKKWRWYIVVSVVASVVGGVVAYWLGALFFETLGKEILSWYGLEPSFGWMALQLGSSGFVFVLIGAFTPIPYKLVAIASGVLYIDFLTFLVASLIGRILRLGLVGGLTHIVGPHVLPTIRKHLHRIAAITAVILIGYLLLSLFKY